jgi:uncharacterized RDD family membrane protein YckC
MTTEVGEYPRSAVGEYAGVVSRGIAFLLDIAIVVVVCTIGYEAVITLLSAIGVAHAASTFSANAIGYTIAVPVAFVAYCAASWVLAGRTLGMFLLGVRVVRPDGESPRGGRSVVRALAYWISAILMLGFIWIMFDKRRQGFHDKIAGTFVVYDWRGRQSRQPGLHSPPV